MFSDRAILALKNTAERAKNSQNRPKMVILGHKIFSRPQTKTNESYFCEHPPEVHFGSVFRFFSFVKNGVFFTANRPVAVLYLICGQKCLVGF